MLFPAQGSQIPHPVAHLVPQGLALLQEPFPVRSEITGLLSLGKQIQENRVGLFRERLW